MKERCRRRNFHAGDSGREEEARGDWSVRPFVVTDIARIDNQAERNINRGDATGNWIWWPIWLAYWFLGFREIWRMRRIVRKFLALGSLLIRHRKGRNNIARRTKCASASSIRGCFYTMIKLKAFLRCIRDSHLVQTALNVTLEISKFFTPLSQAYWKVEAQWITLWRSAWTVLVMPGDIPSGGNVYRSWKTKPHSRVSSFVSAQALERS